MTLRPSRRETYGLRSFTPRLSYPSKGVPRVTRPRPHPDSWVWSTESSSGEGTGRNCSGRAPEGSHGNAKVSEGPVEDWDVKGLSFRLRISPQPGRTRPNGLLPLSPSGSTHRDTGPTTSRVCTPREPSSLQTPGASTPPRTLPGVTSLPLTFPPFQRWVLPPGPDRGSDGPGPTGTLNYSLSPG